MESALPAVEAALFLVTSVIFRVASVQNFPLTVGVLNVGVWYTL